MGSYSLLLSSTTRPSTLEADTGSHVGGGQVWGSADQCHITGLTPIICDLRQSTALPELSFLLRANAHLEGICFLTLAWQLDYGVYSGCSSMPVLQSLWCPAQTLEKNVGKYSSLLIIIRSTVEK